jgi:hypothetical protein
VAALKGAALLEELGLICLSGGEPGDVQEFELADVVPGEDGLATGDLVEEGGIGGGDAGGFREGGFGIGEAAVEA